jgi:hypothetical protein
MEARQILQTLLKEVSDRGASDIHVGPGFIPMLRLHGDLEPTHFGQPLTPEESRGLANLIMGEKLRARFEKKNEVDLAFSVTNGARFRVNIYTQRGLVNLAIRVIPSTVPTFQSLSLPPVVQKLAENQRGLILVSGTTGSGKSTTWADQQGYKAILCEGWDPVMGWRSPNFIYKAPGTSTVRTLTKNYKLSDDIAFRFSNKQWNEYPLTVDKFMGWANASWDQPLLNLFMDYETFGEHQWADSGIFDFLEQLPKSWLTANKNHTFMTVSEAAAAFEPADTIDVPQTITWADTERDLTAWLGNKMQQGSIASLYGLSEAVINSSDERLIADWRKLQTSDHFYYMCTKWWSDGDVHAYFSPYESPYDAYTNFMNAYHDVKFRLAEQGQAV